MDVFIYCSKLLVGPFSGAKFDFDGPKAVPVSVSLFEEKVDASIAADFLRG